MPRTPCCDDPEILELSNVGQPFGGESAAL